jgi:hypothetical protein
MIGNSAACVVSVALTAHTQDAACNSLIFRRDALRTFLMA